MYWIRWPWIYSCFPAEIEALFTEAGFYFSGKTYVLKPLGLRSIDYRNSLVRTGILRGKAVSRSSIPCAIYTRKSPEEGLEQGFNYPDAQREACAAYILCQKAEGWKALPDTSIPNIGGNRV